MTNPTPSRYQFSYVEDEPLPVWQQLALGARPVDPVSLPPGPVRDAISNPEDAAQRSMRIVEEAGRAARAADPIMQIANQTGGNVTDDPGESIGGVALGLAQDAIPNAVEWGAGLLGLDPEAAAEYGNESRDVATGMLRAGVDALPRHLRGALLSETSPEVLVGETVPFSDEIAGTFNSIRTGSPWLESMDMATRRRNDLAERFPATAVTGQVFQGILSAPLFNAPVPAASGVPSVWRSALSGGLRAGREGGIMGTVIGADRASSRPIGTIGSVMSGARPADEIIPAITQFGSEVAPSTGIGALASAGIGGVASGLGAAYNLGRASGRYGSPAAAREARLRSYDDAIAASPSADTEFLPGIVRDESVPESIVDDLVAPEQAADDLATYRAATGAIRDRPVSLRSLPDEAFNNDPDLLRANAVGIEQRNEIRGLRRTIGAPQFSEALDRYGVMPRGEIATTETFMRRGDALRRAAGTRQGAIESAWDDAVAAGHVQPIEPAEVATRIRVAADEYGRLGHDQIARELYSFANDFVETTPVLDPGTGARIASEPRGALSVSEITRNLIPQVRERAYATIRTPGALPVQARAWQDVYRLLNDVRDESIESLGAQQIRDYRLARDAGRIGHAIPEDGRSVRLAHRAGMAAGASLGASLGDAVGGTPGMALGAGMGALVGNAAGRRWVQYEPAVMAAMADPTAGSVAARARGVLGNFAGNLTSPVAPITTPESANAITRLLAHAPDSLGQYSSVLADAARRGTLDVYLYHIQQHDPRAAAEIRSVIESSEISDSDAMHSVREEFAARRSGIAPPSDDPDEVSDAEGVDSVRSEFAARRAERRRRLEAQQQMPAR